MTAMTDHSEQNDLPHDASVAGQGVPPADDHPAPHAPVAAELDDEDDTPAELDDPFAGSEDAKPVSVAADDDESPVGDKQWYILKVQSNREDSIREALQRRISMQGMGKYFGDVIVP
jgi:transcriptional antiterminator NusG